SGLGIRYSKQKSHFYLLVPCCQQLSTGIYLRASAESQHFPHIYSLILFGCSAIIYAPIHILSSCPKERFVWPAKRFSRSVILILIRTSCSRGFPSWWISGPPGVLPVRPLPRW